MLGVAPRPRRAWVWAAALLVRGLRHLADRGCPAVLLYVDGDNTSARPAVREGTDFARYDEDVQWGTA